MPVSGQKLCFLPELAMESKYPSVPSNSDVPGPIGVGTPAAAAGVLPSLTAQRPLQSQATVRHPSTTYPLQQLELLPPPPATAAAEGVTNIGIQTAKINRPKLCTLGQNNVHSVEMWNPIINVRWSAGHGRARSLWSSRVRDIRAALLSRRQLPAHQLQVSRRLLSRHILARPV